MHRFSADCRTGPLRDCAAVISGLKHLLALRFPANSSNCGGRYAASSTTLAPQSVRSVKASAEAGRDGGSGYRVQLGRALSGH